MTTGDKTSFTGEVAIHIDIEYHVESNLLVSVDDLNIPNIFHCVSAFLKGNPHISDLLLNGDFLKVVTNGLISLQGLFDRLGDSGSKLVGFPRISRLDFEND